MIKSPRLIGVEFGNGFDPEQRVTLADRVQLCDLGGKAVAHGFGARIRDDQAHFTQPSLSRRARMFFILSAGSAIRFSVPT
jgi:hypothetical protein